MCKYCKVHRESNGEVLNEVKTVALIRDGSHAFRLALNRYRDLDAPAETAINEFILTEEVCIDSFMEDVKRLHIDIKYCPFCGEKL